MISSSRHRTDIRRIDDLLGEDPDLYPSGGRTGISHPGYDAPYRVSRDDSLDYVKLASRAGNSL